jgi:acyl carrier protein
MSDAQIRNTILSLFRQHEIMKEIGETENFFELGVSSLTIVQLQIDVEKELDLPVPTSDLMRATTINAWIQLYTAKSNQSKQATAC